MGSDRRAKNPVQAFVWWIKKQPPKVKALLGTLAGIVALIFLRLVVDDHDNLFVAAEAIHAVGIAVLIYKLMREKTCAGEPEILRVLPCPLYLSCILQMLFIES
jgi:ER lumen protein retaining receptor